MTTGHGSTAIRHLQIIIRDRTFWKCVCWPPLST